MLSVHLPVLFLYPFQASCLLVLLASVCFFAPLWLPSTKYKSVKIQRQTSCGFHLWNPTKLQEKVFAAGLRIPQPISFLEKTGINCFELPFEDAPAGESQDSECERGCCLRWVWSGRSSCDSFTTTGLTFSRRRRVFVSLPPCCNACSIFVWTLQQQLHSCVTSRL